MSFKRNRKPANVITRVVVTTTYFGFLEHILSWSLKVRYKKQNKHHSAPFTTEKNAAQTVLASLSACNTQEP